MPTKTKILYAITKSNWGGAQRYVYDLATSLPPDKFESVVVGGGNDSLFKKLESSGLQVISIPCLERDLSPAKDLAAVFCLLKILLAEKPDVIHLNSTKVGVLGGPISFLYKLLTWRFNTKVIFTAHGWVFKENISSIKKVVFYCLSVMSSWFYDKVIILSHTDLNSAKKFIPKNKLFLIPNGIKIPNFIPREEVWKGVLKKDLPDCPVLVTVAELTPNKGLEYLLRAVSILKADHPDSRFICVIIGEGEERKKLEKQIKDLGLEQTTFLAGFLPQAKTLLKGFDIFILPSLKEGMPYTILEAMLAGLPIIATCIGGIPDVLKNEKDGLLVPAGNSTLLAKSILRLLNSPEERKRLSDAAFRKAQNNFKLEEMLQKTYAIYEQKK